MALSAETAGQPRWRRQLWCHIPRERRTPADDAI